MFFCEFSFDLGEWEEFFQWVELLKSNQLHRLSDGETVRTKLENLFEKAKEEGYAVKVTRISTFPETWEVDYVDIETCMYASFELVKGEEHFEFAISMKRDLTMNVVCYHKDRDYIEHAHAEEMFENLHKVIETLSKEV